MAKTFISQASQQIRVLKKWLNFTYILLQYIFKPFLVLFLFKFWALLMDLFTDCKFFVYIASGSGWLERGINKFKSVKEFKKKKTKTKKNTKPNKVTWVAAGQINKDIGSLH